MNSDKKYSKMNYEVEIKRLEKRLNQIEHYVGYLMATAITFFFYNLFTSSLR